jgi:flagellar hook-basal body complex protein FliE
MISPLSLMSGTPGLQMPGGLPPAGTPATGTFQDALLQSWQQMQGVQGDAQQAIQSALGSDDPALVETFTAVRESDLALRLMIQIRNKLLDAYQEIQNLRM